MNAISPSMRPSTIFAVMHNAPLSKAQQARIQCQTRCGVCSLGQCIWDYSRR